MARQPIQNSYLVSVLFAGLASLFVLYRLSFRWGRPDPRAQKLLKDLDVKVQKDEEEEEEKPEPSQTPKAKSVYVGKDKTPVHSNKSENGPTQAVLDEKEKLDALHKQIDFIDKKGKGLFKNKDFLAAAETFTSALDLIDKEIGEDLVHHSQLKRQVITLMNNRSAMYEKGKLLDLALHDCETILEQDQAHIKARTRKLRILESLERYNDALVEVCALQLKFMQDNRDKLRLGIPVSPPVPQSKIEDLMGCIIPNEIERMLNSIKEKFGTSDRPLPACHTILQLLQSFTGYNAWMSQAAKDGSLDSLTVNLDAAENQVQKVEILLKRGRRYAYHRKFSECKDDFEAAYDILEKGGDDVKDSLENGTEARILEWVGMCRHLRYDLAGAIKCYEECSDLEPENAEILVKRAGVKMDAGKLDEAMDLFDTALGLDPSAADALLHRANLRMLQQKPREAQSDLEACLELRPDHILARLRLATVLMATEDLNGAKQCLDKAEAVDPQSSEVHSYRGELHFAQNEFVEASAEFDQAIKCDASNPTPYVNAALAIMNTPPANGGPPDIKETIRLLEKAIEVDPQFHSAYVHLGQLKLSMATDLSTAKEVVALYDQGLDYCRTAEELKDIVSMRILTVAQVDAAGSLKMDTLNMQ